MITKSQVEHLIEAEFGDSPIFAVSVEVSSQNDIRVLVDNDNGIAITDCVKVSRLIEGSFDREVEDFSLQVSSPGLDQPLKVLRQYKKNIGRSMKLSLLEGGSIEGVMNEVGDEAIQLTTREKRRIEGRKSKEWVEEVHEIKIEDIKVAKVVISFK
ncbi:MAG: ribosome assembly cofactor RimP [Flavobacteriales bacterium]|nr:ribosome assembly cofactor RimP [Flavobacteriales bacterium]MDG1781454.1 ribosome assembly cofactor RimP [Flavobacteriales bacterium]MDG2247377.1 ribosome assembly cofactor RimP [Flavobacteriales bacterium]